MNDMFVIGIAGGSGSGKSTFAKKLLRQFENDISLVSCDNYYRAHDDISLQERKRLNYDSPDALEFDLMTQHIQALKNGNDIESPVYDFTLHTRSREVKTIAAKPIIIVDGILIFSNPELRECMDLKIYVETDADERILRRAERDMRERGRKFEDIKEQYLQTVKPMHNQFVEPTKIYADIIINGGMNAVALDIVQTKIRTFLKASAKHLL